MKAASKLDRCTLLSYGNLGYESKKVVWKREKIPFYERSL
jgi:hypothetical protein